MEQVVLIWTAPLSASVVAGLAALLMHIDARRLERRQQPTPMSINSYQWVIGSALVLAAAHGGVALGVLTSQGLLAVLGFMAIVVPTAYLASRSRTDRHGGIELLAQQQARLAAAEQVSRDVEYWSELRASESERSYS